MNIPTLIGLYLGGAFITFRLWCWRFPPTSGKGLFYKSNLIHNLNQSIELNHDEYYVKGWSLTGDNLWYELDAAVLACVGFWWFIIPAVIFKKLMWYFCIGLYELFTISTIPKYPISSTDDPYLKLGEDEVDNILQKGNQ
jgi:hypothetical protein